MKKSIMMFLSLFSILFIIGCSNEKAEQEYEADLKQLEMDIVDQSASAEEMINKYSAVWSGSIEMTLDNQRFSSLMGIETYEASKYVDLNEQGNISFKGDFNDAITQVHKYFTETDKNKDMEEARSKISSKMKELNSPPEQYEEAYDIVFELYSLYETYLTLALSPSGSLRDYNSEANRLSSEIITKTKEFEVKLPNE